MARALLLMLGSVALVSLAAPAAAQDRRAETAQQAGLRFLSWPGRPPVDHRPGTTSERRRTPPPPPRPTPPPAPEPEPEAQISQTSRTAQTRSDTVTTTADTPLVGGRYYSVHRQAGRLPDPIPQAQVLAGQETTVILTDPGTRSLADRDRNATSDEALQMLRDMPPDQLMQFLERIP